jgi:hypothetical protein
MSLICPLPQLQHPQRSCRPCVYKNEGKKGVLRAFAGRRFRARDETTESVTAPVSRSRCSSLVGSQLGNGNYANSALSAPIHIERGCVLFSSLSTFTTSTIPLTTMTSLAVHNFTQDELLVQLPVFDKSAKQPELLVVSPLSFVETTVHERPLFLRWKRHVILSRGSDTKGHIILLDRNGYLCNVKDVELPWTVYWVKVRFNGLHHFRFIDSR